MRNELKPETRKIITYIQKQLNSSSQTVQKQIQEVLMDYRFIREGLQTERKEFVEKITPLLSYDFYMSGKIICGPEIFQDKAVIIMSGKAIIYVKKGQQETEQEKYWIKSISRYQQQGDNKKIQQIDDVLQYYIKNSDVELLKQSYIQQKEYFHSGTGICFYKKLCNLDEYEESTGKIESLDTINVKQSQLLIVAEEDCHVLYIDRKTIIQLKQNLRNKQKKIEEIVLSFSGLPFTDEEKMNFSQFKEKNSIQKSTILFLEKDKNQNTIYFIKQGEVAISQSQFRLDTLKQNMIFGFEHISLSINEMKQRDYTAMVTSENASFICIQLDQLKQYFSSLYNFLMNESQTIILKYKKEVQSQKEILLRDSKRYQIEQQLQNGINEENKMNSLIQKQIVPDILLQAEEVNGEYKYKVKFKNQVENGELDSYQLDTKEPTQIKQKQNYNVKINRKNQLIRQNDNSRTNQKINDYTRSTINDSTRNYKTNQNIESNRMIDSNKMNESLRNNESITMNESMKISQIMKNSENSINIESIRFIESMKNSMNVKNQENAKNNAKVSLSPNRKTKNLMQTSVDVLNSRKPADLSRIKQNILGKQHSESTANVKVLKSDYNQSLDFLSKTSSNQFFQNRFLNQANMSLDNQHSVERKYFKNQKDQDSKYQKDNLYHIDSKFSLENKSPADRLQKNEQKFNNLFHLNNEDYGFGNQQKDNIQLNQVFQRIMKFQQKPKSNSSQYDNFKDNSPMQQGQLDQKDQNEKQNYQEQGLSSTRKLYKNSSQIVDQYNLSCEDTINQSPNTNSNHKIKSEGNSPHQSSFSSFEKYFVNHDSLLSNNNELSSFMQNHDFSKDSMVRNSKTPDIEGIRSHKRIKSSKLIFEQNSALFNVQQLKNTGQNSLNKMRISSQQSRDVTSVHAFDESQQINASESSILKSQIPQTISRRYIPSISNQNQAFGDQQHYYQNKNIIDTEMYKKKTPHHQHSSSENTKLRDKEQLNGLIYQSQQSQSNSQQNNEFDQSFNEEKRIQFNNSQNDSQEFIGFFNNNNNSKQNIKKSLSQYNIQKQRQISSLSNQLFSNNK